ncbi:unnamed protein product [Musa acuminata subsp. malaccensis]|uniref:(wild Malaysian banana) hypothetical protein n=1 Tax=Musa acuminata subsp. malaccensis TaxID=214687 RepID=A0A804KH31_MUSAM|nr:unnamed protein product [Musa acuminata subsp. malaccensis]
MTFEESQRHFSASACSFFCHVYIPRAADSNSNAIFVINMIQY